MTSPHCQYQSFDSEQMGAPVGRLVLPDECRREQIESYLPSAINDWTDQGMWLVSCRIPANRSDAAQFLQNAGFTAVETLVTLSRSIDCNSDLAAHGIAAVSSAKPEDFQVCIDIARHSFFSDRYHKDPRIPDTKADELKANWVRNSLSGRADASLVVQDAGITKGFVLCMSDGITAAIDLIAVAPMAQGAGLGNQLVRGALAHYHGRVKSMRVGTQDSNTASIALYKGLGFQELNRHATFHWINARITA